MSSKTKSNAMKEEARPALVPKLRFPEFRGAEGWDVEFLGGICQPQQWTTISSTHLVDEGYPVYGANGLIGYYSYFNHEFETVAVTCRGSTCGEVSLIPPKSYITGNSMCLDGIDAAQNSYHFLYQLLRHRGFNDVISGSAQPQIVGNAIKRLRIALPAKPEQQKIAECLSSVDELMAAQARKVDALKTHKKGLMQQLFPREGETQPRLRFPEFQKAGEWEEDTLDEIATFRRGSFPQPYGLPEWYDEKNGMPFVQVFDVGEDFRLKDKTKSKISKLGAEKSVFIPEGTLIVTLQGSIGRVAITHYDAYIDRTLLIFESFQKPIEKVFFSRVIQNLFDIEKEKAPGGIIKTITKESLSDFKVKYPTIDEQQHIATCLSSLDALITAETQKHEALKTHKKGLMQQLFPSPEQRTT